MAIQTVMPRLRHQVTWFRTIPPPEGISAFSERKFLVGPRDKAGYAACTSEDLQQADFRAGLAAVVFTQNAAKPLQIENEIKVHARCLLDYDCRVIIRAASNGLTILNNVLENLHLPAAGLPGSAGILSENRSPPLPHVRVYEEGVPWVEIANFVAENPPGQPPDPLVDLVVEDQTQPLSEGRTALLRRAFANCAEVHLVEPANTGHSGVTVYRAYAELKASSPWPMPYFVKIGDRRKILNEFNNYENNVDPYIPFHLGPHLIRERCCLGAEEGIIVGDYVEESEPLYQCAGSGRAARAIACLFDHTLLGWHRAAKEKDIPLATGLSHNFPRKIAKARISRAKEFGATHELNELKLLFEKCTSTPVLVGPTHGDLHASNVLVRATDAIVIDFCAHCDYPLVFDAACLEASLLVDGFVNDKRDIKVLFGSIKALYESLETTVPHVNPKSASFWFHACVRQIRRYARQWECGNGQYAAALAVALLTKANKDPNASEPESSRRAVAYALAELVLVNAFGS